MTMSRRIFSMWITEMPERQTLHTSVASFSANGGKFNLLLPESKLLNLCSRKRERAHLSRSIFRRRMYMKNERCEALNRQSLGKSGVAAQMNPIEES